MMQVCGGCKNYNGLVFCCKHRFTEGENDSVGNCPNFSFRKEQKMIKLSNGVEVSEDTIVSALKKAGINIEPKHVFEAGELVENCYNEKRIIINGSSGPISYNLNGYYQISGQSGFEAMGYKFIGRLSDFIK